MKQIFSGYAASPAIPAALCLLGASFLFSCDVYHPAQAPLPPPPPPSILPSSFGPPPPPEKPPTSFDLLLKEGWGTIKCETDEQWQFFQAEIRKFLTSTINPSSLDLVGCRDKDQGRVIFRGKVFFERHALFDLKSSAQNLETADDSHIEIYIYPKTGKAIDYRLDIDTLNSFVRGQNVTLVFEDQKGKVELNGKVKEKIFEGRFIYQNYKSAVDTEGAPFGGILGSSFAVPACEFINCAVTDGEEG